MAWGKKSSGETRRLRAAVASNTVGDSLRDRTRRRTIMFTVGAGRQYDVNITGTAAPVAGPLIPKYSAVESCVLHVMRAEVTGLTKNIGVGTFVDTTAFLTLASVGSVGVKVETLGTELNSGVAYPVSQDQETFAVAAASADFVEFVGAVYITYLELQTVNLPTTATPGEPIG